MKNRTCLEILVVVALAMLSVSHAEEAQEVSQYGITWKFDKPHPVGKFVSGDWWVVGPVTVVSVTPAPGPSSEKDKMADAKSRYGAVAMVADDRMRNGSMIVLKPSPNQGYDSRLKNYDENLTAKFPCALKRNESLISTISNQNPEVPNLVADMLWSTEKIATLALKSAAVLTCLDKAPPQDAFRPPYAGNAKPIYQAKNIQWDRLPRLKASGAIPNWEQFERYVQRPWIDHIDNWMFQMTGPSENVPNYGREFTRVAAISSLMSMLDVPKERKEKLVLGLIQIGIDFKGLAETGRQWSGDGGHWSGRKWPILFAGLMLGDKKLQTLTPRDQTLFAEDQQTYYGKGWFGQTALFQNVFHTTPASPYEEKSPDQWEPDDRKAEGYRITNGVSWPGTALAVLLMKGKSLWGQDVFFDYCDRWMSNKDPYAAKRGSFPRPQQEGKSVDGFVDAMWAAYRDKVPAQADSRQNTKWIWEDMKARPPQGKYVPCAKPAP
jgi:hypothetical protein